jgi:hypothetical protein
MQGGIRIESVCGQGSKFIFWLPYAVSIPSEDASPQPKALTSQARNG